MAASNLPPVITDLEALKDYQSISMLMAWNKDAVKGAKLDRGELTIEIERANIREACGLLQPVYNFISDLTCADHFPTEPRFHVAYHLLSHAKKERVRLQVRLTGDDPTVESITSVWPATNFQERELFDLFGIRFLGHPNLRRILMPEDWEGHPLRRDYPVEGYR